MKKLLLVLGVTALSLLSAASTVHAKGSSQPPVVAQQPGTTPCWFQMPGLLHLVNLNVLASVVVSEERSFGGEVKYTVSLRSASNHLLASLATDRKTAEELLQSIRNVSSECR